MDFTLKQISLINLFSSKDNKKLEFYVRLCEDIFKKIDDKFRRRF